MRQIFLPVVLLMVLWFAPTVAAYQHPQLGRFMQRDPLGYRDGANLYEPVRSSPILRRDPRGTSCADCRCPGARLGPWMVEVPVSGPSEASDKMVDAMKDIGMEAYEPMTGVPGALLELGGKGIDDTIGRDLYFFSVVYRCEDKIVYKNWWKQIVKTSREPGTAIGSVWNWKCPNAGKPARAYPSGFVKTDLDQFNKAVDLCRKEAAQNFNQWLARLREFKNCPNLKDYLLDEFLKEVKPNLWAP